MTLNKQINLKLPKGSCLETVVELIVIFLHERTNALVLTG